MPTPCAISDCSKFAKVHALCLVHARVLSLVTSTDASPTTYTKAHRLCSERGCASYARRLGKCSRHGGARLCSVRGCATPAQTAGKCRLHGGGTLCKQPGCTSFARTGGWCAPHARSLRSPPLNDS
ncbi:hypothetical protein SPRG_10127 [Saprolegnia parasitica CBS 223.65]|uniref:C2H2-type domain-containing protein n=1 Tax=Saprolegnia parasitica (strain CBS 223.65) TaxID=695850 RepID=A0A067CDH0_SAPPC|nr:hypothetical protein SPRG_10127 [Saprolegnia parasitica CBS 223.65]KDO24596.1 hypothetical protein SPRG_10127 [Saprolegnia parasitica CBS 223.65]|eukprot:XP_012204664.1 hypothetical protein SPRG_10127 [Saprolegnia parasitica CBS 223.65]